MTEEEAEESEEEAEVADKGDEGDEDDDELDDDEEDEEEDITPKKKSGKKSEKTSKEPKKKAEEVAEKKPKKKAEEVAKKEKGKKEKISSSSDDDDHKHQKSASFKMGSYKDILNPLNMVEDTVEDAPIEISKKGVKISMIDGAHICLIIVTIDIEDCEDVIVEDPITIGVKVKDLLKMVKRGRDKDSIEFKYISSERKIQIVFKQPEGKKSRTFSIGTVDAQKSFNEEDLAKLDICNKFTMNKKELNDIVLDADAVNDAMVFGVSNDKIFTKAVGIAGSMESVFEMDELEEVEIKEPTKVETSYSVMFLKNLIKPLPASEKIHVSIKDEHPFRMFINILEKSSIDIYLTPRVNDSDEDTDEED